MLQLLALGIDCEKFDFINAPPVTATTNALRQLEFLGAIKISKTNELTQLGRNMAKFPLDPKYSKIILSAPSFGCLEEVCYYFSFNCNSNEIQQFFSSTTQILSIVAILSGEDIFVHYFDNEKRAEALIAHQKFENKYGDHLTLLNVFKCFSKAEKTKTWCQDNCLNNRNLSYAMEVRKQLQEICTRLELEFSSCGTNYDQVNICNLLSFLLFFFFIVFIN